MKTTGGSDLFGAVSNSGLVVTDLRSNRTSHRIRSVLLMEGMMSRGDAETLRGKASRTKRGR